MVYLLPKELRDVQRPRRAPGVLVVHVVMWFVSLGIYIVKLEAPTVGEYLQWGIFTVTFLPGFAVGARRLHDTGHSVLLG